MYVDHQKMENVHRVQNPALKSEADVIHLLTTSENDEGRHNSPDMFQPSGKHRIDN